MEELISLYKKSIILYDYLDIFNIFMELLQIKEKMETLDDTNKEADTLAEAINSINEQDICSAFLYCYYTANSHKEYNNRLDKLYMYIKKEGLTERQKQEYVNILCQEEKKDKKGQRKAEEKIRKIFQEEAEEIIENLHFLATRDDFHYIYYYISQYINRQKYTFTQQEIMSYIEKAKEDTESNKFNKKIRYIRICFMMKEVLLEPVQTQIEIYAKDMAIWRKHNETESLTLTKNIEKIKQIFQKDRIAMQDIKLLQTILKEENLINKSLQLILEHNNEQRKKKKEPDTLENKMRDLFSNIEYESFSLPIKKFICDEKNSVRVTQIMSILSKNKIELEIKNIEKILIEGKEKNMNFIGNLLHKNYIENPFINRHIELLTDTNVFLDFLNKINLLVSRNLDLKVALQSIDLMKIDMNHLLNNLYMLEGYKIRIDKKGIHSYKFLIDTETFDIIDLFIEEGLSDIIRNHPEYLNPTLRNVPKRIHINHLISSPVRNEEKTKLLSNILYEKYYFLSDEELDSFLCNHTEEYVNEEITGILKNKKRNKIDKKIMEKIEIQQLDNHFLNGENYLFGTTTISRIKFLINYSILQKYTKFSIKDLIYNALIYNSYLLHEELLIIKREVESIYGEKILVKDK